jgi:hypothetical protein
MWFTAIGLLVDPEEELLEELDFEPDPNLSILETETGEKEKKKKKKRKKRRKSEHKHIKPRLIGKAPKRARPAVTRLAAPLGKDQKGKKKKKKKKKRPKQRRASTILITVLSPSTKRD